MTLEELTTYKTILLCILVADIDSDLLSVVKIKKYDYYLDDIWPYVRTLEHIGSISHEVGTKAITYLYINEEATV